MKGRLKRRAIQQEAKRFVTSGVAAAAKGAD
jgi:hypothetical protein